MPNAEHRVDCTFDEDTLQGAGHVQGGIVAGALADVLRGLAAVADRVVEVETIDVAFERPAAPGTYLVTASSTRSGRTLMAWQAVLTDASGRTIATARTTHRVSPRR